VRGETEGADRRDESGDRGSTAADGFGRGRWKPARGEEWQTGKEEKLNHFLQFRLISPY